MDENIQEDFEGDRMSFVTRVRKYEGRFLYYLSSHDENK